MEAFPVCGYKNTTLSRCGFFPNRCTHAMQSQSKPQHSFFGHQQTDFKV